MDEQAESGSRYAGRGHRLTEVDEELLAGLASVVEESGRFSFGIVADTLSVVEQLDFGYRLVAVAGRIRTRAEATPRRHSLRPTSGDAP